MLRARLMSLKTRPGLFAGCYLGAVPDFPGLDEVEKCVSICRSSNPGDLEEDLPQLAGVGGLRGASAPGQTLPLDMDQAALDDCIRPECSEDPDDLRVAIYGETARAQAFAHHRLEERAQLWLGVLTDVELSPHQPVSLPVHQDDDAVGAVKESPVKEKMPGGVRLHEWRGRRLGEEALDQAIQLPLAVPALLSQLACRVPLHYPSAEPLHLPHPPGHRIAPAEGATAGGAEPPLPTVRVPAETLGDATTSRTPFLGDMTP